MPGLYRRIEGNRGRIDIVELGAPVGEMASWTLTRRGNVDTRSDDPEADFYDLFAVLRFVNKALLEDPEYTKTVRVFSKKTRSFTLESRNDDPRTRMAVSGHSLTMERVLIVPDD